MAGNTVAIERERYASLADAAGLTDLQREVFWNGKRYECALVYCELLVARQLNDDRWASVNKCLLRRFKTSGLRWIKMRAWALLDARKQ